SSDLCCRKSPITVIGYNRQIAHHLYLSARFCKVKCSCEKAKYRSKTSGKAKKRSMNRSTILINRKIYLNLFSLHASEDNFILNKRISDTNRKLTAATTKSNTQGRDIQAGCAAPIKGKDMIKKAFIGVLSPINSDACRSSTLNFANRNAENAVTINPKYGR